jgi:predicted Fe-Mo cluster-binding NifX family protein
MKIAVVTDDKETISQHFGRAQFYLVYTIADGKISSLETRPKPGHDQFAGEHHSEHHGEGHGSSPHAEARHGTMMEAINDCQVLIARGMGMGARNSLQARKITSFITDIQMVQAAVEAYLAGTLQDHPELLH